MKKLINYLSRYTFCVMPASVIIFCSWENADLSNSQNLILCNQISNDTIPQDKFDDFGKGMEDFGKSMSDFNLQLKDLDVKIDKEITTALSKIHFEDIGKQVESSLKQIDWNKMQNDINVSVQNANNAIAKIDFTKMQNDMKRLQEKFNSDEFKSQFNSEKLNKEINDAMDKAKEGMEKANQKLQRMKNFTDELAADGLIDKKKGYTIEWKEGELYINGNKQPKNIADKYRKYEDSGKINVLPDNAEHF